MDGLNVYLGLGIVFLLAAALGEVEALGVRIPPLKSRLVRAALALSGAALVVAAFVAPLPGTAATERSERRAAYQRQVLAACDAIASTRATGDNALRVDDRGRMSRDQMVSILGQQWAQESETMRRLLSREVPEGLRPEWREAEAAWQPITVRGPRYVSAVRGLPDAFTQEQLERVTADVAAAGGYEEWSRFRSAMSELAGGTCKLPA
ncbi:hypothetical protein [Micromonospora robiginosa]|uniref:Uncharacterized protein n=1 Tax=Micromonospora robiginosa TaxID=2749844 RepID=A0A7L6BAT9_9ACTN|nr:hypothetical protein [Micromonospora ferruginea]QLQ39094.1 hypothetical protein H1D33_09845 [Micromonospora ferruginea]